MTTNAALILSIVVVHIGLVLGLGRFLTLLDRDDPGTFAEVATPEEIHLGRSGFYFLGNMKFLLYHIIPGSYEHWNLSPETMTYARRFRVAVALGISLQVGIVMYLLLTLV